MMPVPTLYLRFIEREELVDSLPEYGVSRTRIVRVLQQFWENPGGSHAAGNMFNLKTGTWRDVPLEREA